jgi:putative hydrolases of HD superfamily
MLAKTPRSGYNLLGTGEQSVAEHTNRVCYVGYVLAQIDGNASPEKTVMMCLFHDIAEARTLDHNYLAQRYVTVDEDKAVDAQTKDLPFGQAIRATIKEYEDRDTLESLLAKDADNIELILFCKEQLDIGNPQAQDRIDITVQRIKTDA